MQKILLKPSQFKLLATFCREISQAAIVGAFGAWLLPGVFNLDTSVSLADFSVLSSSGLTLLIASVILEGRGA